MPNLHTSGTGAIQRVADMGGVYALLRLTRNEQGDPLAMARRLMAVLHSGAVPQRTLEAFWTLTPREVQGAVRRLVDFNLAVVDMPEYLSLYLGGGRPGKHPSGARAAGRMKILAVEDETNAGKSHAPAHAPATINYGGFRHLATIRDQAQDPALERLCAALLLMDFTEGLSFRARLSVLDMDYATALGFAEEMATLRIPEKSLNSFLERRHRSVA